MWFWWFMLVSNLMIPLLMLGIGHHYIKKDPGVINQVIGYRTSMSMKNVETWRFAHKHFGRIWYLCGLVMLPLSIVFMLPLIGKDTDTVGWGGAVICIVQMVALFVTLIPTEHALRQNFDKDGNPRRNFEKNSEKEL